MAKPLDTLTPKARRTRQTLIDAARVVIGQDGLAGLNVMRVCQMAGVGRTSFYDYFDSADGLTEAVAAESVQTFKARFDAAHLDLPRGLLRLRSCLRFVLQLTVDDPETALLLTSLATGNGSVRSVIRAEIAEELNGAKLCSPALEQYLSTTLLAQTRELARGRSKAAHLNEIVQMMMAACGQEETIQVR